MSSNEIDKIKISLTIGEAPKRKETLSRQYIISKNNKPFLSAKFIPNSRTFSVADILKTKSLYSRFNSIKVPKMISHFSTAAGHFFIEEYLNNNVSLAHLIERGDVKTRQAKEIIQNILSEIWSVAEPASTEFINKEKSNYKSYFEQLIEKSYLHEIITEHIEKVIDCNLNSLKRAWSSGDIMDRNILLFDGHWYLIDYEYCHQTLFLFKEAYRSIIYSKWAKNVKLNEMFPNVDNFPEEVAILLSLAWEKNLYSAVLDINANRIYKKYLRKLYWGILYPDMNRLLIVNQDQKHKIEQLQTKEQYQQQELNRIKTNLECQQQELNRIKYSIGWRLISKCKRLRDRIFSVCSKRRNIHEIIVRRLRKRRSDGIKCQEKE